MPLSFKLLILGAKIVILFETIKSIMVHKRKFLILALSRLQNKVLFHWYIYHFAMCSQYVAVNHYWFRQNKKAWELICHSSHSLRPSHCPVLLNEQRRSPRRYVVTFPYTNIGHLAIRNMPYQ